jgi:hygromycin-B 7''-O-kinase
MNNAGSSLAALQTLDGYRQSFLSTGLWEPHLQALCTMHGWSCEQIIPGKPGTFPTFIVDDQRVIKFFGPLFTGEQCWQVEQEAASLIPALPSLPVPQLLASGDLPGEPGWHYLVFEVVPGVNIGDVYSKLPIVEKLELASWLGSWLPELHRLRPPAESSLPRLSERLVHGWFADRWAENSARWPAHLAAQVEGYINKYSDFIQTGSEAFIHADLTRDHLIGSLSDGHWTTQAIIDFGDAKLGNLYYELAAVHLDLFGCDKRLLAAFLEAYGFPPDLDFSRKAMVTSLLHEFDVIGYLFTWNPKLQELQTLEQLESCLWKIGE